jgi:hypothetical protein
MNKHWSQELENVPSQPLRTTWYTIAKAFMDQILEHGDPAAENGWRILSPPTGAGKTESIVIYCAMLAEQEASGAITHPGALIVTRLIDDCERIARRINRYGGGRDTAVAYHSKSDSSIKLDDLSRYPVVVITHRAYELALDNLGAGKGIRDTWSFFHDFGFENTRKLIVVDECLDIVEHSKTSLDGLRFAVGIIPQAVRDLYPVEIETVERVIDLLATIAKRGKQQEKKSLSDFMATDEKLLPKALKDGAEPPDLSGLIKAMDGTNLCYIAGPDPKEQKRARERCKYALRSLHYVFRSWSYYSQIQGDHTLNSARLLVPEGVKGAVVMDATAETNTVYEVFKLAKKVGTPDGVRSYRNVTLHAAIGNRTGKNFMQRNAKALCGDLMNNLNPRLKGRKVFACCHKAVEPILSSFDTTFEMHTGHWGAVDGSNQWKDCDTAVIFGLPHLPDTWTANVFMALQGPQDTRWLNGDNGRPFKDYKDIRQALKRGQLSTSIIQAINRIQCRKVIDADGNCPKSEVYVLLPDGKAAEGILRDIVKAMPGIKVDRSWALKKSKKRARRSKHAKGFVKFMEHMKPGQEHAVSYVQKVLGMSRATMQRLIPQLKDTSSDLHKAMTQASVYLDVRGQGRGMRTRIVKTTTKKMSHLVYPTLNRLNDTFSDL